MSEANGAPVDLTPYKQEIARLRTIIAENQVKSESNEIGKLAAALAKAQGNMQLAAEVKASHYGKYADLGTVIKTSRAPLSEQGLSVVQRVVTEGGGHALLTRLCHQSGEWMEGKMRLAPARQDIQSMGSYITYVRRYCYASIIGMAAGDDDDDGVGALSDEELLRRQKEAGVVKRLTKAQAKQISDMIVELPEEMQSKVMDGLNQKYGIDRVGDLPDTALSDVMKGLAKMRQAVGLVE